MGLTHLSLRHCDISESARCRLLNRGVYTQTNDVASSKRYKQMHNGTGNIIVLTQM